MNGEHGSEDVEMQIRRISHAIEIVGLAFSFRDLARCSNPEDGIGAASAEGLDVSGAPTHSQRKLIHAALTKRS